METEYNSYRLGLTKRSADWLVNRYMHGPPLSGKARAEEDTGHARSPHELASRPPGRG